MNHDIKHKTYFNTLTRCEGNKPIQDRNHKFPTQLRPINLITRKLTCENAKNKTKKYSMSAIILCCILVKLTCCSQVDDKLLMSQA